MLTLSHLSKSYNRSRPILQDINFHLNAGEYVAIMGESGTGKSTLLNLMAGLETPDSGSIIIDGHELAQMNDDQATQLRREKMGFVFQAFHVLPHLSVAQNVALPLLLNGVGKQQAQIATMSMLAAVGLAERAQSRPHELSGGETQRVAIARALVHRPRLLLADEPTGNLDSESADSVMQLLREQIKQSGTTCVLVTHSTRAAATADRVLLLTVRGLIPQGDNVPYTIQT